MVRENPLLMRTRISYDNDMIVDDLSKTGRKEHCVWNNLGSFHCIDKCVDVMHDILEGVAPLEIALVLENLIYTNRRFSLETLNSRIANFNYGPFEDYNLPQTISQANYLKSHSLKYSSSETTTLIKFLQLLIGDLVNEEDKVWAFFLLLRQVCNIVFAYSLEQVDIDFVEYLICEHHKTYQILFKKNLLPKHHLAH